MQMTARAFLVRGLLVGLLAGVAAFVVAHQVGEPSVERAIALEEAATGQAHTHGDAEESGAAGHSHDEAAGTAEDGGTEVSRATQSTWGLATGTLAVGVALGGIVALVAAGVVGRLGRLTPAQSTGVVALVGFTAYSLVPFLKYPATPPAVGSGDTIGERTGLYFAYVLVSVVAAAIAVVVATRSWQRLGPLPATAAATAGYLLVVVAVGNLMPTVNEVGDFPADTLWFFRRASLLVLATTWAVLGVGLAWAIGRLHEQTAARVARRELAASL